MARTARGVGGGVGQHGDAQPELEGYNQYGRRAEKTREINTDERKTTRAAKDAAFLLPMAVVQHAEVGRRLRLWK